MSATSFILTTDGGVVKAALSNENGVEVSPCGSVLTSPDIYVPLYRSYNKTTNGHFYTVYIDEYDDTINDGSHVGEGIACHCFAQPQTAISLVPIYRGYNATTDDHLYTTDPAEIYVTDGAYAFEGLVFYLYSQPSNGAKFWRLRDPTGARHLCTGDVVEYNKLLGAPNSYIDEGVLGYTVPNTKLATVVLGPLYEAYSPNDGNHFYTMDFAEREKATNTLGMKADGICCYLYKDGLQPADTLPLFRAYNAKTNNHVYTTNQSELNELSGILGFKSEGTAGWVLPELPPMPAGSPLTNFGPQTPTPAPTTTNLLRVFGEFTDNLLVPPPSQGLGSFSNYIMNNQVANSCLPITGLVVEMDVLDDIVCSSVDFGAKGFSLQVNCESIGSSIIGWQQYVITLWGPNLIGIVNNWYVGRNHCIEQLSGLMPIDNFTLTKGWRLKIELLYDENSNVIGVKYHAFDTISKRAANVTQMIADIPGAHAIGVAPIGTCQTVLVGPISGSTSVLTSGRGTFTCTATSPMRPSGVFPSCVLDNTVTGESANTIYGPLPAQRQKQFVQEFSTKPAAPNPFSYTKWLAGVKRSRGLPLPPREGK